MMQALDTAGALLQLAMTLWWYVVLPVLILAGCYVYLQRNAATQYGIASDFEKEGNLAEALKHYERAADCAKTGPQRKAAEAKAAELRQRMRGE